MCVDVHKILQDPSCCISKPANLLDGGGGGGGEDDAGSGT